MKNVHQATKSCSVWYIDWCWRYLENQHHSMAMDTSSLPEHHICIRMIGNRRHFHGVWKAIFHLCCYILRSIRLIIRSQETQTKRPNMRNWRDLLHALATTVHRSRQWLVVPFGQQMFQVFGQFFLLFFLHDAWLLNIFKRSQETMGQAICGSFISFCRIHWLSTCFVRVQIRFYS